jgi:hypothetical protein
VFGTLGAWDAIGSARLGTLSDVATQRHDAVLIDPTVQTLMPPTRSAVRLLEVLATQDPQAVMDP